MEGLANAFQGIAQGIKTLGEHFSSFVTDILGGLPEILGNIFNSVIGVVTNIGEHLNPFGDNFILKDVLSFFGNIVSYLNPFGEDFILKDVVTFIGNILSYINPFSENFFGYKIIEMFTSLFRYLFIPTEDHFTGLKNTINSKFPFVGQVSELVRNLFSFKRTRGIEVPPSFSITYYGVTTEIINFEVFSKYRAPFHALCCAVLWIPYLLRLLKRLPAIIHGYEGYPGT